MHLNLAVAASSPPLPGVLLVDRCKAGSWEKYGKVWTSSKVQKFNGSGCCCCCFFVCQVTVGLAYF